MRQISKPGIRVSLGLQLPIRVSKFVAQPKQPSWTHKNGIDTCSCKNCKFPFKNSVHFS